MPASATLVTLVFAALVLLAVPGPSVAYAVARTVGGGRRAGFWSVLGLEAGMGVHVLAAAAGVAALAASTPTALTVLRVAGAGYLFHLGLRPYLRARCLVLARHAAGARQAMPADDRSAARLVRDGVLVDLLNPKTCLFFVAFLPQFVDPVRGSVVTQMLVLGACVVLLALLCDGLYVLAASGIASRLRTAAGQRRVGAATAAVYVTLGVLVLVQG